MNSKGINYFNPNDAFFFIDSYNLERVRTRLYGFSVQLSGIYDNENLTNEGINGIDGRGCYVYINVSGSKISIQQDIGGCQGIYLFRHEKYFAISNSFYYLLENIENKYHTTINIDFANCLMVDILASHSVSETLINEISLIDRNSLITIDIPNANLKIESAFDESKVSLDSVDGMKLLDNWYYFWIHTIREIRNRTPFLQVDLSGGYDSRLSFLLILCSGIDLNGIRIFSADDSMLSHTEDYEIASKIADHFCFKLNRNLPDTKCLNYSQEDIQNIECYTKMGFHKEPYFRKRKYVDKIYYIGGFGGEAIRNRYSVSAQRFIEETSQQAEVYSPELCNSLVRSVKKIIETSYRMVKEKYSIDDVQSSDLPQYMYRDGWSRNHFGKVIFGNIYSNRVVLAPLMDPNLWKLCLDDPKCTDKNLLMVVILSRYCPELMEFPYEGKRYSIDESTVEFARMLNKKYPLTSYTNEMHINLQKKSNIRFHVDTVDKKLESALERNQNNHYVPDKILFDELKRCFDSSKTRGIFTSVFDPEIYDFANRYYNNGGFSSIRHCYAVLSVVRAMEVQLGRSCIYNESMYGHLEHLIKENMYEYRDVGAAFQRFAPYFSANVYIEFLGTNTGNFQLLNTSDKDAKISQPKWLQKEGIGYVVIAQKGDITLTAKSSLDGTVRVSLRGVDIRNPKKRTECIPYWIDYTELSINDQPVLQNHTSAWLKKPFVYNFEIHKDENITVKIRWQPHQPH